MNNVQKAKYVFPKWYIEFLKTTNGLNIFLNSISLFGEQTPIVENKKIGKTESLLERENICLLYTSNKEALPRLIDEIKNKGYTFKTVLDL